MNRTFFCAMLFIASLNTPLLFAGGKKEEAAKPELNKTWILCVTNFDTSGLPESRKVIGTLVTQNIVHTLLNVPFHQRLSEEETYHQEQAWGKTISDAAKKIVTKQNELGALIFFGYPGWKYKKERVKKEKELAALQTIYEEAQTTPPVIMSKPEFKLTPGNLSGTYPAPPAAGSEYTFCTTQKADAFLSGVITDFHGRVHISIKMFTLHDKKYSYTDSIIVSPEEINLASDELAAGLIDAVSLTEPAAIIVRTNPENAQIVLNSEVIGRGQSGIIERSPGKVEITTFAENHQTRTLPLELAEGQLTEVSINLRKLPLSSFDVSVSSKESDTTASVYRGALYAGKTPVTITAPEGEEEQISVESADGRAASTVIKAGTTPVVLLPKVMPEEGAVEKLRRKYYGSSGRFWITLPLAVVALGAASAYRSDYSRKGSAEMQAASTVASIVSYGTLAAAGAFLGESIVRFGLYLKAAATDTSPIARRPAVEAAVEYETIETSEDQEAAPETETGEETSAAAGEVKTENK
jgi:hypothetical protein